MYLINKKKSRIRRIYLLYSIYFLWSLNFFSLVKFIESQRVLNILILLGIFLLIDHTFKKNYLKPSFNSLFISSILNLLIVIRSVWVTNYDDKFPYIVGMLLLISFLLLNCRITDLALFNKTFALAAIYPVYGVIYTPLSYLLIPNISFLTWLIMWMTGFETRIININQIIIENKGISVDLGCSGVEAIFFSLTITLIYLFYVPIKSKSRVFLVISINTIIPIILNILRIVILGFSVLKFNNFYIFDFFHDSYGSYLFILISSIFASENYQFFLAKEKNIKY